MLTAASRAVASGFEQAGAAGDRGQTATAGAFCDCASGWPLRARWPSSTLDLLDALAV